MAKHLAYFVYSGLSFSLQAALPGEAAAFEQPNKMHRCSLRGT